MFVQRSAIAAARRAAPAAIARRTFTTTFVRRKGPPREAAHQRPIDLPAGDAKPEATHEKEAGHSANAPSVLAGLKKLDGT